MFCTDTLDQKTRDVTVPLIGFRSLVEFLKYPCDESLKVLLAKDSIDAHVILARAKADEHEKMASFFVVCLARLSERYIIRKKRIKKRIGKKKLSKRKQKTRRLL